MSETAGRRAQDEDPFATHAEARRGLAHRRRQKILAELDRNRQGGHRVPTWVMVVAIVAILAAWAALLFL